MRGAESPPVRQRFAQTTFNRNKSLPGLTATGVTRMKLPSPIRRRSLTREKSPAKTLLRTRKSRMIWTTKLESKMKMMSNTAMTAR